MPRTPARFLVAALLAGCAGGAPPDDPDVVSDWMRRTFVVARVERLNPVVTSRLSAYAAIALYEAAAAFSDSLRSMAGQLNGLDSVPAPEVHAPHDRTIVAAAAQRAVFRDLLPDAFPTTLRGIDALVDSQVARRVRAGVKPDVRERSLAYGERLGSALGAWAARDGFDSVRARPFSPSTAAGTWINTTADEEINVQALSMESDYVALKNPAASLDPAMGAERGLFMNRPKRPGAKTGNLNPTRALEPWWGDMRTFAVRSADECRAAAPVPYSENPRSAFYAQARAVYDSSTNDEARRQTAFFWADNPAETGTPAAHWVSIMSGVVQERRLGLERAAEAHALMSIAIADAFISGWRDKYRYQVIRPVTYIRRVIDSTWTPSVVTPPFPEYPSGHSLQSGAAAEILGRVLGDAPFADSTQATLGHATRRYRTFREAAEEAARSRLYGGIHYPMAIWNGLDQGRCVATKVLERVRTRR